MPLLHNLKRTTNTRRYLRNHATPTERLIWGFLRRRKLGVKFRRQHGIRGYTVDFYCPQIKLAIEIDGNAHAFADKQKRDRWRQEHLEGLGIIFFRCTSDEIYQDVDGVVGRIESLIKSVTSV